jgi:two-component system NtrC family sensor kinase
MLLAVLMLAVGTAAAWWTSDQLGERLLEEVRLAALRMADTVKGSTRFDMLHARFEGVRQIVVNVGQRPGLEHVRIYNKEGKIVYSSRPQEESTVVDLSAEACYQCHAAERPLDHLDSPQRARVYRNQDGRVLAAIDVVYNEAGCSTSGCHPSPDEQQVLGVVDVGVSLRDIDERIAEAGASTLAYGLGATILVCGLIGLFVYSFVTRPLRRLLRGIQKVSRGELQASLPVGGTDEVGALGLAFNQMTADLRSAHGELTTWAETLEQQVEERTGQLRQAQEQIIRAEKLSSLGILAAGVAHELNSPLTGILTFSHLMLQDATPGTRNHEDLQLIVNETQRCATIIRQLLEFSREGIREHRPQSIVPAVQRALALVEHQAKFHKIRIESELEEVPPTCCDANQIQQVFLNLLINAAEAMPEGGTIRIHVHAEDEGRQVVAEVSDTGTGIPPEHLGRIFDPFFTSKEVGKGTGLGLSVSYGIVRRHHGTISVRSEVGKGTTFRITIPVGPCPGPVTS